jgi:hypothetical protein
MIRERKPTALAALRSANSHPATFLLPSDVPSAL